MWWWPIFSWVLAGPLATMTVADLGATKVKVERPGVDDEARAWGPPWTGHASAVADWLDGPADAPPVAG